VLGDEAPAPDDYGRLGYTEAVIKEALRLYPPAWAIGREAVTACEIGGRPLAPGTTVFISPWVMHRDARYFDQPEEFRPERWLDPAIQRVPRFAYLPFGGGPRLCIGNGFAMMEAVLLLATLARRFRVALVPGREARPFPTITLRPGDGVWLQIARR